MLLNNPVGHFRFLAGIEPYSCGVVADSGWEIVRVTLAELMPWREGFDFIDDYLRSARFERSSLCAMELRSPQPFAMDGFIEFNRCYREVLEQWNLLVNGVNPIARTNVAPLTNPPTSVSFHAFSFIRPNADLKRPTFVVAGAGELREGILESDRVVRRGEVSPGAMLEKAEYVLGVMTERLKGLGMSWDPATAVNLYTVYSLEESMRKRILDRIGPAARHGLCWHIARPPVLEIEFEMDVRGLACELTL
ncbi:MAG: hypothetical protein EXS36_08175 [Pedosphaera sp.]|nr:hypothetical protein [Pedosphaera sp.]